MPIKNSSEEIIGEMIFNHKLSVIVKHYSICYLENLGLFYHTDHELAVLKLYPQTLKRFCCCGCFSTIKIIIVLGLTHNVFCGTCIYCMFVCIDLNLY